MKINPDDLDKFLKDIAEFEVIKVSVYDQGFSSVKSMIQHFDELAQLIIVLSSICSILMIGVFIFLEFVKRKADIMIMNSLGCGKKRIVKYLLLAALLISIPASVTGATVGHFISGNLINQIQDSLLNSQSSISNSEYLADSKNIDIHLNLDTESSSVFIALLVINLFIIIFSFIGILIYFKIISNSNGILSIKKKNIKSI